MLTLITGTPGAGKSLYAVSQIAAKVPGTTLETAQEPVKRVLYSNVKDLVIEHEKIDADDLNRWHEWAPPGAVILFDEVQEVWRPRGLGSKVPDCIAKLETHRHMGVDLILVTQHPMLLDSNIRRLVNQHLHVRRITKTITMVYEWDHCSNPGQTRDCVDSKIWRHPTSAYKLYKSAQVHTKPTAKVPKVAWLGVLALAGLAYAGPNAYDRITTSLGNKTESTQNAQAVSVPANPPALEGGFIVSKTVETTQGPPPDYVPPSISAASGSETTRQIAGCIVVKDRCGCFDSGGIKVETPREICLENSGAYRGMPIAIASTP